MKKKKKILDPLKILGAIRREAEIREYGKLISLRPSKIHKNKKKDDVHRFNEDDE